MNRGDSTRIFGIDKPLTTFLWWFVFLFPLFNLSAQTNLTWNKTLGGDGYEELQTMVETADGNFVFFGSHTSNVSGDITQASRGLSDYWLAKVDQANGNIIWQNTYGGNLIDNGRDMVATSDGGFLLGGHSSTGINGTKTDVSIGACWNCIDYWVVKTDGDGNQLWDKTIKGNQIGDRMTTLMETSDGGFVVAGYSDSDAANDKSEANIGGTDYWVVKLDVDGNQLWDRTLGGTGDEQPFALVELSNGTILVGGLSFSLDDGNRTAPSRGLSDYWIVNLDADGNILWDQAYGGMEIDNLRDMIISNDGGVLLIGESYSGATGEKSDPSNGERDIWMVKIDEAGNFLWDSSIGASDRDQPFKVTQSPNNNFLIASLSKSPADFDRSQPSLGGADYWFITTDANGNIIKEEVFGGDQNDNLYYALPMQNGDIILGGITATDTSPQKTEPSRGNNDIWLLKYESTLEFSLGNDTIFCVDGMLNLDAVINPCDCCVYAWEDGSTNPTRNLVVDQDTSIILSVHDGFNSLKIDTINIVATEPLTVDLGGDAYLCAGDSIFLDAQNPGQDFLWSPGSAITQELTVTAGNTYQVTVTDQYGCTYGDQVTISDVAITITPENPIICIGDSLFLANAWQTTSGMYIDTLDNYVGCDSIIMTDLFVATIDTTRFFDITCDQAQAGIFSITMDNQYFCDSTIINTVTYIAPDTTRLFDVTCDQAQAGISFMTVDNQYFCDSTIINTITYIAPDTTRLFDTTCDQAQAGIFSMTMDNQYFCDSTIINTITYIAPDTTRFFDTTCDQAQAGIFSMTMDNQYFCDSTIINTVTYIAPDTTRFFDITCDEAQAGIFSMTMDNQYFCDSTIINTATYIAPDTTRFFDITCDEAQAGIFSMTMDNQYFCDSTIINTVTYIAPDTTRLFDVTCDQAQAGISFMTVDNQYFCDSTIINTITYIAPDTTRFFDTTCDQVQAGIFSMTMDNQYFCDSTIINTITYIAPDTTRFFDTTCDQAQAGIFSMTVDNQYFCDSTIINTVTYIAPDTTRFFDITCDEAQAGIFSMTMDNQYFCDSTIINTVTYIAPDTTRFFDVTCDEAQAGIFSTTVSNQYFCDSTIINTITYIAPDTTRFFDTTCDEAQAGIFSTTIDNQYFCDSTIINTITYIAPDTTRLFNTTCVPSQTGIFFTTVDNQYFCDSTIINTITFAEADTTRLFENTCNQAQAGVFSVTMQNQDLCDSTIINTVTYIPPDLVSLTEVTCDEAQAGLVTNQDINIFGCDSTTMINFIYLPPDTTELLGHTCDASQAGLQVVVNTNYQGCDSVVITDNIFTPTAFVDLVMLTCDSMQVGVLLDTLQSQYGCDSLVTTVATNYIAPDTTNLVSVTCDSNLANIEVDNLIGFRGCDSIVITEIQYFSPVVTNLFLETCDPAQAGTTTSVASSQAGCDSLITIIETTYQGSANTLLTVAVCDPDLTGTDTNTFTNQFGCDSTVILTTTLLMADTTYINFTSCDPDSLGVDTLVLSNQIGCDSIIYFVTNGENLQVDYEVTDASCFDLADGSVLVNTVLGGMSPHVFAVDDGAFQSFALFPDLELGMHTLWVQDADGCTAPYEFEIQAPAPFMVSLPNDTTINIGTYLTIPVTANQAVDTIFWNEDSGINCDSLSCLRPEIQPLLTNTYIVTAANEIGCSASDTIQVSVTKERPFYIPSAFSPNADGINDNFVLSPGPNVTMIHSIRIFNRWGALLYESPELLPDQSMISWDGKFRGQFVTSGVYIYVVDVSFVDGERTILSGDVTVVR